MTRAEFEALNADGYDCRGDETLDHDTIEDCIETYLDAFMQPDCNVAALIKETGPVEVTAFRRSAVTEKWIAEQAESALEAVAESWCEKYGDPDGEGEFPDAVIAQHRDVMAAVLRSFLATETVWACDEVGSYEYSLAEVEAMMRERRPDWFAATERP